MVGQTGRFALTPSTRSFGKTRQSGQFALPSRRNFHSFHVVAHCDMNDSSEWRTTAWASGRRSHDAPLAYARCAVDYVGSANVSEAVEAAVVNLLGRSAPLTIFTSPARKTFGEKLLTRPIRHAIRVVI